MLSHAHAGCTQPFLEAPYDHERSNSARRWDGPSWHFLQSHLQDSIAILSNVNGAELGAAVGADPPEPYIIVTGHMDLTEQGAPAPHGSI